MFQHFMIMPFLLGLGLGIAGIYFLKSEATIVYKYPTPENVGKLSYKDKNGVCYQYSGKEVDCDKTDGKLKTYPLN
jgi:hypothetical protein